MDDASLDDFLGDDDGEDEAAESADADDGSPDEDAEVEPALATASFDPDGVDCEGCGASVERLWRNGDAMVCGACKEW